MADIPQGPDAQVGQSLLGGNNSRKLADVKAGIKIDSGQLNALKKSLSELRDITKEWREQMEGVAAAAKSVQGSVGKGGVGGGGGGGNSVEQGFSNLPTPPTPTPSATSKFIGKAGGFMAAAGQLISPLVGQMDSRIDRGIAYATSADRLNMLTQQMTGMSQMQAMNQRKDLSGYKLGMGGINEMIAFQNQTGIQTSKQLGQSVEAIRASTGFTKTTADIMNEQRQLMDPTVANRMFFMGGVNAYNIGGGMKDPLQMRQEIVRNMGLSNPAIAKSALMPGSVTRARMADMGLGEEMQTEILQYAQQQSTFEKKGGKGMYDPSKASHRQLMGVNDNLATQQEETERVTAVREEQFMRRQIDNMAALEKSNQDLIKAMASLEDTMSGVVGARISGAGGRAKQQMIGGGLKGIGSAMMAGGAATAALGGSGLVVGGIGAALYGVGAILGDPPDPEAETNPANGLPKSSKSSSKYDGQIKVPYGYSNNRISLNELKNKPDFNKLHPRFKSRLLEMMRVNPNVGLGGGTRDTAAQEQMFRSRYTPTNEDTGLFWDGTFWKHTSGAAAAPPGQSYHEIGLAADLVGDLDWMNAHAGEFGLNHFANVNNEPWHVQPSDIPNSRAKYEQQGAPWGTDGNYNKQGETGATPQAAGTSDGSDHGSGGQPSGVGTSFPGLSGLTISEAMAASRQDSLTRMMASGGGSWSEQRTNGSANLSGKNSSAPLPPPTAGALSGAEVARLAYNAGFRGKDLAAVVSISHRESRWKPGAYNPDRTTKDDSYGLMQINMLGDLGPARLQQFGISKYEDLYDPQTNMNAAYVLYQRSNNTLNPWGGYKGEENTYNTDLSLGEQAVREAGLAKELSGDPTDFLRAPTRGGRGGANNSTTNHITSSPTINVAPVINFNGAPSTPDLRNIAQTVSRLIKEEVDALSMRTA